MLDLSEAEFSSRILTLQSTLLMTGLDTELSLELFSMIPSSSFLCTSSSFNSVRDWSSLEIHFISNFPSIRLPSLSDISSGGQSGEIFDAHSFSAMILFSKYISVSAGELVLRK